MEELLRLEILAGGNHPRKHPRKNIRASAHQEASAPEGISRHPRIPENRAGATDILENIRISAFPEIRNSEIADFRIAGFLGDRISGLSCFRSFGNPESPNGSIAPFEPPKSMLEEILDKKNLAPECLCLSRST